MSRPTWTILIPTLGQRGDLFQRLLGVLLPQLDAYDGDARVLAWWNNGQPPLPYIRQALVQAVETEYLSFVDDDDLVSEDFVAGIVQALETRPDHVGFQVQYYVSGVPRQIIYHSMAHGRWYQNFRDVAHIDPVRADLARLADFRRGARPGKAEDRGWVRQMRRHLKTEVVVDRVLYHYLWSNDISAWRQPDLISQGPFQRPAVDSPHFAWHPGCDDA